MDDPTSMTDSPITTVAPGWAIVALGILGALAVTAATRAQTFIEDANDPFDFFRLFIRSPSRFSAVFIKPSY